MAKRGDFETTGSRAWEAVSAIGQCTSTPLLAWGLTDRNPLTLVVSVGPPLCSSSGLPGLDSMPNEDSDTSKISGSRILQHKGNGRCRNESCSGILRAR